MKLPTLLLFLFISVTASSHDIVYQREDSLKVIKLLNKAPEGKKISEYMIWFGHQLAGVPYVAKTLDKSKTEKLVVNLRELDCTTFTETTLALSLCKYNKKCSFTDFTEFLSLIRYKDGEVAYDNRLHYFSSWIEENTKKELVKEENTGTLFSGRQKLNINFMSTHASLYPQLAASKKMQESIAQTEKQLTGKTYKYIPKKSLRNYKELKKCIHTGDIIVILTSKKGLDTSHIGIASWHKDGTLHLLNASQIHKKVIDEPMTLYTYMQKHPTQIGIRVVRVQ